MQFRYYLQYQLIPYRAHRQSALCEDTALCPFFQRASVSFRVWRLNNRPLGSVMCVLWVMIVQQMLLIFEPKGMLLWATMLAVDNNNEQKPELQLTKTFLIFDCRLGQEGGLEKWRRQTKISDPLPQATLHTTLCLPCSKAASYQKAEPNIVFLRNIGKHQWQDYALCYLALKMFAGHWFKPWLFSYKI